MARSKSEWIIYLIVSERGRTYVGATTDVSRRLRQHNGEIRGGARATRKEAKWSLLAAVVGFRNRAEAYRWESLVKKRARGVSARFTAMLGLVHSICPASVKGKNYVVPKGLKWRDEK